MCQLRFLIVALAIIFFSANEFLAQTPASNATQSFIAVEGADLKSKLEAARKKASAASPNAPYWAAYNFDVRPGVAIDPHGQEFNGYFNSAGGTNFMIGTSNGVTAETRNIGIFLLYDAAGERAKRVEIYNLERRREYGNYPVYWLGRAGNEESLNFLQSLLVADQQSLIPERAALAIALHDDARVAGILKNQINNFANARVRSSSVFWLGQIGGDIPFLVDLVRREQSDDKLRRTAVHAIGASRDRAALAALQALYGAAPLADLKRVIVHAVADNADQEAAYNFLLKVAKADVDRDARRQAIHRLAEKETPATLGELEQIYAAEQDARLRRDILHAYSRLKNPRASEKLFELARQGESKDLRRQAIHLIGEMAGQRSLEALRQTLDSSGDDVQVQVQAVHSIGQRPNEEAIPLLIKIARTHASTAVRKRAIQRLGEFEDERVLAFFSELLK